MSPVGNLKFVLISCGVAAVLWFCTGLFFPGKALLAHPGFTCSFRNGSAGTNWCERAQEGARDRQGSVRQIKRISFPPFKCSEVFPTQKAGGDLRDPWGGESRAEGSCHQPQVLQSKRQEAQAGHEAVCHCFLHALTRNVLHCHKNSNPLDLVLLASREGLKGQYHQRGCFWKGPSACTAGALAAGKSGGAAAAVGKEKRPEARAEL